MQAISVFIWRNELQLHWNILRSFHIALGIGSFTWFWHAAIYSTSAHFSSGLVVQFSWHSHHLLLPIVKHIPVLFHASVSFPAIVCRTISHFPYLRSLINVDCWDNIHHSFPSYLCSLSFCRQDCGILLFRINGCLGWCCILLFRIMLRWEWQGYQHANAYVWW